MLQQREQHEQESRDRERSQCFQGTQILQFWSMEWKGEPCGCSKATDLSHLDCCRSHLIVLSASILVPLQFISTEQTEPSFQYTNHIISLSCLTLSSTSSFHLEQRASQQVLLSSASVILNLFVPWTFWQSGEARGCVMFLNV